MLITIFSWIIGSFCHLKNRLCTVLRTHCAFLLDWRCIIVTFKKIACIFSKFSVRNIELIKASAWALELFLKSVIRIIQKSYYPLFHLIYLKFQALWKFKCPSLYRDWAIRDGSMFFLSSFFYHQNYMVYIIYMLLFSSIWRIIDE